MTTTKATDRIDAMRDVMTGEIAPAHMVGHTKTGREIYHAEEGWEPVARIEDGSHCPSTGLRRDRDGNWIAPKS